MPSVPASRQKFLIGTLLTTTLSALLVLLFSSTRAHDWLESGTYDSRVRWSAKLNSGDPDIVIVDVDNASFEALKELFGRWPWSRHAWSETSRYLARGKPRVIVFDMMFGGRESDKVDQEFATRIQAVGNVVLGYSLGSENQSEIEVIDPTPLDAKWKLLDADSFPAQAGIIGEHISDTTHPPNVPLNVPLDSLAHAAAGLGATSGTFDADGTLRRVPLQFIAGSRIYRSLALRAVDLMTGIDASTQQVTSRRFSLNRNSRSIPLDRSGRLLLLWHGNRYRGDKPDRRHPGSFPYLRIPFWQVVCSIAPQNCDPRVERFAPEFFQNKIVFVGASATGSYDAYPTPFSDSAPGFLAHATAIDNLLHAEAIRVAPQWVMPVLVLLLALSAAVILAFVKSTIADILTAIGLLGLYVASSYLTFARWHLWVPLVAPVAAFLVSYFSVSALRYVTTGRELRRTRNTLDRYISPKLVNYVLENLERINLAGEKRELTIFFSDVRNFTTLAESTDPTELIALLNEYFAAMTDIVFKYDGIVDKFIGDGILAYWGAFTPGSNHALMAAQASLEMLKRLEEMNRNWEAAGRKTISIGIGLNTGEVIFGNVGSGKKVEFTVIGDPVNLAARLEGLNKDFATSIVISEFTRRLLGEEAQVRTLGNVKVKGKTVETSIFELRGLNHIVGTAPTE